MASWDGFLGLLGALEAGLGDMSLVKPSVCKQHTRTNITDGKIYLAGSSGSSQGYCTHTTCAVCTILIYFMCWIVVLNQQAKYMCSSFMADSRIKVLGDWAELGETPHPGQCPVLQWWFIRFDSKNQIPFNSSLDKGETRQKESCRWWSNMQNIFDFYTLNLSKVMLFH